MLNRDEALDLIRRGYAARAANDKEALARFWADGARFQIAGDNSLNEAVPFTAAEPMVAIGKLMERFEFSNLEELDSVVDGRKLAIRWRVTIKVAGHEPRTTELLDLIELNDAGKITSFVQFADTALIRHLAA